MVATNELTNFQRLIRWVKTQREDFRLGDTVDVCGRWSYSCGNSVGYISETSTGGLTVTIENKNSNTLTDENRGFYSSLMALQPKEAVPTFDKKTKEMIEYTLVW